MKYIELEPGNKTCSEESVSSHTYIDLLINAQNASVKSCDQLNFLYSKIGGENCDYIKICNVYKDYLNATSHCIMNCQCTTGKGCKIFFFTERPDLVLWNVNVCEAQPKVSLTN